MLSEYLVVQFEQVCLEFSPCFIIKLKRSNERPPEL